MKKYCTRCGRQFEAVGREVICPSCKAQAAAEAKKAAVLKAKRASWTGESVPVRISGRASTVIREFATSRTMTFAEALDTPLKESDYFASLDTAWEDITPYKSHRRDKATSTPDTPDKQDAPQASKPQASKPQGKAQDAQDVPQAAQAAQAAKVASKARASKARASKARASKAAKE